jgi:hypothetical protein
MLISEDDKKRLLERIPELLPCVEVVERIEGDTPDGWWCTVAAPIAPSQSIGSWSMHIGIQLVAIGQPGADPWPQAVVDSAQNYLMTNDQAVRDGLDDDTATAILLATIYGTTAARLFDAAKARRPVAG